MKGKKPNQTKQNKTKTKNMYVHTYFFTKNAYRECLYKECLQRMPTDWTSRLKGKPMKNTSFTKGMTTCYQLYIT